MASLPGATVLYRLNAGGGCRVLGGPCEHRLTMCLCLHLPSFSGTSFFCGGQVGATDTSARYLPDLVRWLPLIWKDL